VDSGQNLTRSRSDKKARVGADDGSDDDDADAPTADGDADGAAAAAAAAKRRRAAARARAASAAATLERDPAKLELSARDAQQFDVDPLFHKMSRSFDEARRPAASSLALASLPVEPSPLPSRRSLRSGPVMPSQAVRTAIAVAMGRVEPVVSELM